MRIPMENVTTPGEGEVRERLSSEGAPVRETAVLLDERTSEAAIERLGDFTTNVRVVWISALAIGIGALSAVIALALLRLIGLCTNLLFFGRWSTALVSPAGNHLGAWELLVPVGGALVVGLMARY